MDQQALRVGNLLVGNPDGAASVEIAMGGFRAEFLWCVNFAITGADMEAFLNGRLVATWKTHRALSGDILELRSANIGIRSYLTLAGGVMVTPVMASRSTFLRGGFGGFHGRPLRKDDLLSIGDPIGKPILNVPNSLIPPYSNHPAVRVLAGPQDDCITPKGLETFFSAEYRVTDRSDRMGTVLSGPKIDHRFGADIISDGTAPGAIQVPGSGQPMILTADCQTTGGYVKIATIIAADLPLIAQLGPGDTIRFEGVSLDEARLSYLKNEYLLRSFHERNQKSA
jgi:biotin-dependent carboxylase-like uncharacterized protein